MALAGALFGLKLGRRPARKKFLSTKSQERCSFELEPVISTSESGNAASTSPLPSFLPQNEHQVLLTLLMTTLFAILVHFGSQYQVPAFHNHSIAPSIRVFWPTGVIPSSSPFTPVLSTRIRTLLRLTYMVQAVLKLYTPASLVLSDSSNRSFQIAYPSGALRNAVRRACLTLPRAFSTPGPSNQRKARSRQLSVSCSP